MKKQTKKRAKDTMLPQVAHGEMEVANCDLHFPVRIITVRGRQVVLDSVLADLYQVPTMVFNQSVKRNAERFPPEFRFQLTKEEFDRLTSQFVISKNQGRGGRREGDQEAPFASSLTGARLQTPSGLRALLNADGFRHTRNRAKTDVSTTARIFPIGCEPWRKPFVS